VATTILRVIIKMCAKIAVGVITYKRNRMLKNALMSIAALKTPDFATVEVIVVDNDENASAKEVVYGLESSFPFRLYYLIEEKRGIPFARNKIIEKAIKIKATELAFIDDDEIVERNWLQALYNYYKKNDCDAVAGPVEPILPKDMAKWLKLSKYYQRRKETTGTQVSWAGTGNILFSMDVFTRYGLRFDWRFASTGSTDTLLTRQLTERGGIILWLDEVLVREEFPRSKLCMRWMLGRAYRCRINNISFDLMFRGVPYTYFFSSLSLIKNFLYGLLSLPLALLWHRYFSQALECFAITGAIVCGLLGKKYHEYDSIHGS